MHSKNTSTAKKIKLTNVSTTGKSTKCIYKVNNQVVNPTKVCKLNTNNSFKLYINGVSIEISDSVKNIQITPSNIYINI